MMNHLGTMYATKRRRRNIKRNQPKDQQAKTNPSKRHRERLNAELDLLASLLPFEQSVLSKLDKLSILRLSVSYLRTKSYFQCIMSREREACAMNNILNNSNSNSSNSNISNSSSHLAQLNHQLNNLQVTNQTLPFQQQQTNGQIVHHQQLAYHNAQMKHNREFFENFLEGDLILQALNGFLFIITCDGTVFYISHTVETYLGYPQSDVCHQSVYDLVHSEDREELQRHLMWNSALPNDKSNMTLAETLQPENFQYLERNFTVRFRCLLDNTSGFLRLEIRGRVKVLHGQNLKALDDMNYNNQTPLALFAVCTPFGPPSLLEMPSKENLFKSKHRLDLGWLQLDLRGRKLLGIEETDLTNRSFYDLVHHDDFSYVANAHSELIKTGASGLIAYRLCTKNGENSWQYQWLQTSARLIYKNSKMDFIICTHRPLMNEEGRDLYGKRTMDFKVTYLDGGLGALNAADRIFDCMNEKSTDDRSTKPVNNSSSVKSAKVRKTKADKKNAIALTSVLLNHTSSTGNGLASSAFSSNINGTNGFEHALNYTPTNGTSVNNLTQSTSRYSAASLSDYYNNSASHSNGAYYNGYPGYNSQTNVTIINNNYNLNVTSNGGCIGSSANMKYELPTPTSNNASTNESSSCSSNSSFSSCSTIVKKKLSSSTNEEYDQFNHLINSHSSHAFHPTTTNSSTVSHLNVNSQQPSVAHLNHLNANQLNLNFNNLNQNAMLLNGNTFNQTFNQTNNNTSSTNSNQFSGLNNSFVYSPTQSNTQSNLSPVTVADQLTTNNSLLNTSHTQQLQSQLVGLSHGSSPLSLSNSTTSASTHLHDQSTQLSPSLSTASNSNLLQQQQQNMEAMEIENNNVSNSSLSTAAGQHQSNINHHHLNNSINELGSPQTLSSNSANSPQSNSSSSVNTNLSCTSSTSSPAALALSTHYPYNVANHTPHHFLHYSRLSSYYHPEYHLYNYFEPKFNTVTSNNLIGNNLIGNGNLFSNEHNLFMNNPSTNVF